MEKALAPVRAIGVLSLTAVSVNTVIGAGIFALPAIIAQLLGPASPWAYVIAGIVALFIALCFADAGSRFESSGGPYVYARAAFGNFIGFEVAWLYVITRLTAMAAVSTVFCSYLGYFWPPAAQGAGQALATTALIAALAGIGFLGVRLGAAVNNILTAGKLLPLLVFCVAGLFLLKFHAASLTSLPQVNSLQQASLLLIFALGGFEVASVPGEEVINPKKNIPAALLASVSLVVVLYLAIQVVAMAALPGLAGSATPLASAAARFLGPAGSLMLTLGAVVATAGNIHANMLVGPRVLYALGRDGNLPAPMARLHSRYRTPGWSILVYALAAWLLALSSTFVRLAALSALARLLVYTSTCLAVPVLQRTLPSAGSRFRLPGGLLIPACALALCVWLFIGSTPNQALLLGAALLAGAVMYRALARGRARSNRR